MLLLHAGLISGQQQDAVITGAVQVQKNIDRTFSASLFLQGALQENFSEPGYWIADLGVRCNITDYLSVGAHFRHSQVYQLDNTFAFRNYVYGECIVQKRWSDLTIAWRGRYITKYYSWNPLAEDVYRENKHYARGRFLLRYDLSYHHDIFGAVEQVYRLDEHMQTERMRYSVGYGYTFNNFHKIQLNYTVSTQENREAPDTDYISGVTYFYKF